MADQFRADCLGASGNRVIHTPNLDRLAAEGVRFTSAYSSTPTCTPARAALLTGSSPWRHGMLKYARVAERYPVEMPRALGQAGYYTTAIGKCHYHPQRNAHGFHEMLLDESGRVETKDFRSDYRTWFSSQAPDLNPDATGVGWNDYKAKTYALPERLHPTNWTGETAANWIKAYNRPQPFLLKVSFARPHSPYDPPERFMKRYADAAVPERHLASWAERYAKRSDDTDALWHGDLGAEAARHSRQGYYGSVTFVDEQIGRILEALHKRGFLEESVIVFLTDHGDMLGDHNLWRKSYPYEASAKIPMLLRAPAGLLSGKRGRVESKTAEIRDILPAFLDAAGAGQRPECDGGNLLSLANGKPWREFLDLEHGICYGPDNHWNALTDGRMKYVYHAREGVEQLFDLQRDPHELRDLASVPDSAGGLRMWRQRLTAHLEPRGERFVRNGRLIPRPKDVAFSPNYPGCSCHPVRQG
jgi:arylsulfatase